ncbi:quinol dehydrogenase ferredoxin subunit NapH [Sulfurimonas sp.]|uniref:quinol dehydrogenase ferredoxin subunit NapH n=1 Tax=Sulfurimonas sp. TaxID=2022749 RepID=UPI003D12D7A9
MSKIFKYRYYLARRTTQLLVLGSYFLANLYGWSVVQGNLSSSLLFGFLPLSDPFATLQTFLAGAVLSADVLIGVAVVLFFYGVVGGRFFCSWVCPVNIITETAAALRRKLGLGSKDAPSLLSRHVRYWVIALTLLLSFVFSISAFEVISPIGMAHRGIIFGFGMGWFFLLALFFFDLFSQKYGWCGHICPLGGFNAIVGKYSLIKITHDVDKCIHSQECFLVCPEVPILHAVGKKSHIITSKECIKCARCIEVCDSGAFEVSIVGIAKQLKEGA